MLALDVAQVIAGELETSLTHNDTAAVAVPGGTTPGPIFDNLCAADLNWARISVLPSDERWVPAEHARSNERLIRERLFVDKAAAARFVPLYRAGVEPDKAIGDISASLAPSLPLSVLVLGMGADMHTASLFPDAPGLQEALQSDAPAACLLRPADQPEVRVSLSAPVLRSAISTHLIVTGAQKRAALEAAHALPPEAAPVRLILDTATIHWAV